MRERERVGVEVMGVRVVCGGDKHVTVVAVPATKIDVGVLIVDPKMHLTLGEFGTLVAVIVMSVPPEMGPRAGSTPSRVGTG